MYILSGPSLFVLFSTGTAGTVRLVQIYLTDGPTASGHGANPSPIPYTALLLVTQDLLGNPIRQASAVSAEQA